MLIFYNCLPRAGKALMFRYKQRTCGFSLAVKSVEHKHTHSANKLTHLYLSCVWQDEKLTRCAEGVMFPIKPVLLSFWWGVKPPKNSYLLSWPVLSCTVLSYPVLSVMPLAALAHPRQSHRDLSCRSPPERQRALSAPPISLCVPLSPAPPGFGSVNPLLFSPPLSRGTRRGSPPVHPP